MQMHEPRSRFRDAAFIKYVPCSNPRLPPPLNPFWLAPVYSPYQISVKKDCEFPGKGPERSSAGFDIPPNSCMVWPVPALFQKRRYEMWAPTKIQCGVVATVSGIVIESLSVSPFHSTFLHSWFGTVYQLLVGLAMMAAAVCTLNVGFEELNYRSQLVYRMNGWVLLLLGAAVTFNISRYDLVFSHLGSWPVRAIGIFVAFNGAIALGHALTVYQPPPPA